MEGAKSEVLEPKQELLLTAESIDDYLQAKLDAGVALSAVNKYKNAFSNLRLWLADEQKIDAARLLEWRRHLESTGYSKYTVQSYVKIINNFLRCSGYDALHIPKPVRNDLTGKIFGYLTVVSQTEKRQHRYVVWKCICKCGKEVEVPSGMLLGGHTTSCGCLNIEILRHHNRYEEGTELRQAMEENILNPNSVSGYTGVYAKRGKWAAQITYKKKHYYLGTYSDIEDAIKARAKAKEAIIEDAARIYKETNHRYGPSPHRPQPPEKKPCIQPDPVVIRARRTNNTSGYSGVIWNHKKWDVSISINKYRYKLGTYEELDKAIAVRKRAEELVKSGDFITLKEICTNRVVIPQSDDRNK